MVLLSDKQSGASMSYTAPDIITIIASPVATARLINNNDRCIDHHHRGSWVFAPGLFHRGQNNHFQAERCFTTAGRLSRSSPPGRGATAEGRGDSQGEGPNLQGAPMEGPQEAEQEEKEEESAVEEKGQEEQEEVRPGSSKPGESGVLIHYLLINNCYLY